LRRILSSENAIRPEKRKGSPVAVDRTHAARIAEDYKDSIPFARVEELLGVGGKIARKLAISGLLPIWIPGGRMGKKHRYVIRRRELDAWVDALVGDAPTLPALPPDCLTLAEAPLRRNIPVTVLVDAVRSGKIRIIGTLQGHPRFGGAVVFDADVAAARSDEILARTGTTRSGPP